MGQSRILGLGVIVLLGLLGLSSLYVVDLRERAILLRLGEMVGENLEPGIHFKLPIIDDARKFDRRLQTLDISPERFLTQEKKNLIVDFYVKWRIEDVGQYYRATGGSHLVASQRLEQIVKDGLRAEFGKRTVKAAVSGERAKIMDVITRQANELTGELGISVREVRIKRMDLPESVSGSVFSRMEAERERIAREFRAEGEADAERIRAEADRQRTVILAEAYREAERIRGHGDATAAAAYAEAYRQDPEFYAFVRSLQAYRAGMGSNSVMVLEPGEQGFFKYFEDMRGR